MLALSVSAADCRFAFPCFVSVYPGREKSFLVMYVLVLVFYIIFSLTYFYIKMFVRFKQRIPY